MALHFFSRTVIRKEFVRLLASRAWPEIPDERLAGLLNDLGGMAGVW